MGANVYEEGGSYSAVDLRDTDDSRGIVSTLQYLTATIAYLPFVGMQLPLQDTAVSAVSQKIRNELSWTL